MKAMCAITTRCCFIAEQRNTASFTAAESFHLRNISDLRTNVTITQTRLPLAASAIA